MTMAVETSATIAKVMATAKSIRLASVSVEQPASLDRRRSARIFPGAATPGPPSGLTQREDGGLGHQATGPARVGELTTELSFSAFFEAEYPGLVRGMRALTRHLAEAEELAQEAMARAYERWERVRAMDSPQGYVYRVAVNLNRKRVRRLAVSARRLLVPTRTSEVGAGSDIAMALEALPANQREALVMVVWFGLSAEEAAPVLGI
jgi:DNA-directed RNA polymerase specialized sigma24 family protein